MAHGLREYSHRCINVYLSCLERIWLVKLLNVLSMSKWCVDTDCMFISFDYINCRGIELVKSLNVYIIRDSRDHFLTILMFKSVHGIAPTYLSDRVVVHFDVNGYDTRGSDMGLYLPCCVKRLIGTVSCIWVANCGMIFPSLYKILPILNHSNVIIKYTNCSLAPDWFKIFALFCDLSGSVWWNDCSLLSE